MKWLAVRLLRRITGRTTPAAYKIGDLHYAMGRMADGSPGGIEIIGATPDMFIPCRSRVDNGGPWFPDHPGG